MTFVASAPGKAMLAGEYAVLSGEPAVVAAVDRRLWARIEPSDQWGVRTEGALWREGGPVPPELTYAVAAVEAARKLWSPAPRTLYLWDALSLPEGKLGLGRSAAATVACAFAAAQGVEASRDELWNLADEVHRVVQGRGSGVDVAASVHGGVIRFTRSPREAQPLEVHPDVRLLLVWSGRSASTAPRLERFFAFASARPKEASAFTSTMHGAVRELEAGLAGGDLDVLRGAVAQARSALIDLEERIDIDLETSAMRRVAEVAWAQGSCGKLSGAGGGDCAIALTVGDDRARALQERLEREGLVVIPSSLQSPGAGLEHWADAG